MALGHGLNISAHNYALVMLLQLVQPVLTSACLLHVLTEKEDFNGDMPADHACLQSACAFRQYK
jgi:hypothetical protein